MHAYSYNLLFIWVQIGLNSLTSLLKSRLQSRLLSFRQSLLFYPIIFSSCALVLFLITSRIDELAFEKLTVDIPFLKSLVFAGSPNAARIFSRLSQLVGLPSLVLHFQSLLLPFNWQQRNIPPILSRDSKMIR